MALNKVFIVLLICSVMAVLITASKPNNLIVGSRAKGDRLLKFRVVKVQSKVLSIVTKKEVFAGGRITQVKILDQNKKGNGAKASIVQGGPGKTSVSIDFKSQRGHSIDFIVEVYGK